jgi:hypothetical protein
MKNLNSEQLAALGWSYALRLPDGIAAVTKCRDEALEWLDAREGAVINLAHAKGGDDGQKR